MYNPDRQLADHRRAVCYEIELPHATPGKLVDPATLYIHPAAQLKPMAHTPLAS